MGEQPSPVKVHGTSGYITLLTTTSNAHCTEPSTALTKEIIHCVIKRCKLLITLKQPEQSSMHGAACASCQENCFEMKAGVAIVRVTNLC